MAYDFPNSPSVGQSYQGYTWDGEKWIATLGGGGKAARYIYTATGGQTTFSGADAFGATLAYYPGTVEVAVNGLWVPYNEYTATNGTSIVLASASVFGDIVYVHALANFSVLDALQRTLNGSDILVPATFRSNLGLGSYAIASLGQLPSSQNNVVPTTGMIGELLQAGGSATLTSGVSAQICSLPVAAGVWDLFAYNAFGGPGATSSSDWNTAISTSSATVSTNIVHIVHNRRPTGTDIAEYHNLCPTRININSSTTYYLNSQAAFTVSTYQANGVLFARRTN
jgi:hypothetical protein